MLERLYLNNCFTHQDRAFRFDQGLTGITGPNESGKSLIVEMIRFALFGSKALRGKAEDYKTLHVELDFVVRGVDYRVMRKGAKVSLDGGDRKASGTRPVDQAIRSILGYDLVVFDVANACNQGDVEALSNMAPTARKAMVDKTVGLDVLDELIRFAGQEGNGLKREAEAVDATLVEPEPPARPEDYLASAEIDIQTAQAELGEFNQLAGFLSRAPAHPTRPARCTVVETVETLTRQIEARRDCELKLDQLEIEASRIEPEAYSGEELEAFEARNARASLWQQKQKLLARGHICCPKCHHEWPVADLSGFEAVAKTDPAPLKMSEIARHRERIGNADRLARLKQAIDGLEKSVREMPDRRDDLAVAQTHAAEVLAYDRQLAAFEKYNADLAQKQARFDDLGTAPARYEELQNRKRGAERYEQLLAQYAAQSARHHDLKAQVTDIQARAQGLLEARRRIQELKVKVKTFLLPSLNTVASVFLSRMTGGARHDVEVSDSFEITIDGQPINTLSGSGKAVANLAIRIALGQILTNRTFSVFLADEVDASMDDERAQYTAEALRRLTDLVGQVVLVTHKDPDADQRIALQAHPLAVRGRDRP